jgi:hypothetical protein
MIIGNTSLDPRKIIYAQIIKKLFKVYLLVTYSFGDLITSISIPVENYYDGIVGLKIIEKYAHKDDLIDAISDKTLEEVEDSLSGCYAHKMGFKC